MKQKDRKVTSSGEIGSPVLAGDVKWCSRHGRRQSRVTTWPSNPTPGYVRKRGQNKRREHGSPTQTWHVAVLGSIILNRRKVATTQTPARGRANNRTWYVHTEEYYSATKRDDVLTRGAPCCLIRTSLSIQDETPTLFLCRVRTRDGSCLPAGKRPSPGTEGAGTLTTDLQPPEP